MKYELKIDADTKEYNLIGTSSFGGGFLSITSTLEDVHRKGRAALEAVALVHCFEAASEALKFEKALSKTKEELFEYDNQTFLATA